MRIPRKGLAGNQRSAAAHPAGDPHIGKRRLLREALRRREEEKVGALVAHDLALYREHVLDALLRGRHRQNTEGFEAPLTDAGLPARAGSSRGACGGTRFAHQLPRLDVHGATIEFEREVEAGSIGKRERKDAVGNDANGERLAGGLERYARMEGASSSRVSSGR